MVQFYNTLPNLKNPTIAAFLWIFWQLFQKAQIFNTLLYEILPLSQAASKITQRDTVWNISDCHFSDSSFERSPQES